MPLEYELDKDEYDDDEIDGREFDALINGNLGHGPGIIDGSVFGRKVPDTGTMADHERSYLEHHGDNPGIPQDARISLV
jgi:hypothetical protein